MDALVSILLDQGSFSGAVTIRLRNRNDDSGMSDENQNKLWGGLIFAVLTAGYGYWTYRDIAALEAGTEESIRLGAFIAGIYDNWGLTGIKVWFVLLVGIGLAVAARALWERFT